MTETFSPLFHMPVIAPAPADYAGDAVAYYAEVAQQTAVTLTAVEVLPEQMLTPSASLQAKGLVVTLGNPDATFQYAASSQAPAPPAWRTLFAMAGGFLRYIPSGAPGGLNPALPPPFDTLAPVSPAAPVDLTTPAWGTLALDIWPADSRLMQEAAPQKPSLGALYYVGADEAAAAVAIKPLLAVQYPQARYDASVSAGKTPALQKAVEGIKGAAYGSAQSYATLLDDYVAEFKQGTTSVLVKGGSQIGAAILADPGGGPIGRIEFWAMDAAQSRSFQDISDYFWAGAAS